MTTKLTREQAEAALHRIEEYYAAYIEEGYGPKLVENWDGLPSGPRDWAIVWLDGADDWAYRVSVGGVIDRATMHVEAATFKVLTMYPA